MSKENGGNAKRVYRGDKPVKAPEEPGWKTWAKRAVLGITVLAGGGKAVQEGVDAYKAHQTAPTPETPRKTPPRPMEARPEIPASVIESLPHVGNIFLEEHVKNGLRKIDRALEHNRHPSAADIEAALADTESLRDTDLFAYLGTNRSDITSLLNGDLGTEALRNGQTDNLFIVSDWLRNAEVRERLQKTVIHEAERKLEGAQRGSGNRNIRYIAVLEHLLRPVAQASPAGNPHHNLR